MKSWPEVHVIRSWSSYRSSGHGWK